MFRFRVPVKNSKRFETPHVTLDVGRSDPFSTDVGNPFRNRFFGSRPTWFTIPRTYVPTRHSWRGPAGGDERAAARCDGSPPRPRTRPFYKRHSLVHLYAYTTRTRASDTAHARTSVRDSGGPTVCGGAFSNAGRAGRFVERTSGR